MLFIKGSTFYGGEGTFTIDNNIGGSDAVALLTYHGRKDPLVGVYIQKGSSYTIRNINDGTYDLFIYEGENWNSNTKKFENNPHYLRFEDTFPFTTSNTEYTTWKVTLYTVVGGNADTQELSEDSFPAI